MNSFYFLHIFKTAGRFFEQNVITMLQPTFVENNIEEIFKNSEQYKINGHGCWFSGISDKTYICSILRDPVKRLVSHYAHERTLNFNAEIFDNSITLNKKDFLDWYEQNSHYNNYQVKNFLVDEKWQDNKNPYETLYFVDIDKEKLNSKLNKTNLLLRSEKLSNNVNLIKNLIIEDMQLKPKHNFSFNEINKPVFKNEKSFELFSQLNDFEKNKIYESNKIDSDLYFNDSLFRI
jgi:hypothetical protein